MGVVIDASSPAAVTGNPTTVTASFTPPDDAVLVVGWAGNSDLGVTPTVPTITDSLGVHLTYTLAGHSTRADTGAHPDGQAALWTAQVGVGAAMTVTVTNTATTARHAALNIWVVTGAAVGTFGKGCNGFATTTVVQSYTATADGSQGFLAVADWDATGTETAGSGCTVDSSGTIAGPQISYGFLQRTTADGANGGLTTLTANLPGSSASLNWVYVELTPLVGDPAEKDPPPFIWWCPPGPNAPNGAILPWSGTADAAPTDTRIRIHENSPGVALNTAGTSTATTTASFTPPPNSLLLLLWSGNSAAGANPSAPTVTDSLGSPLTYTLGDWMSRADSPLSDGQVATWTAPVGASPVAMTVTVNNNAASSRHAALQVLVLTGQNATPMGVHGKVGSTSATQIAQAYTATATLGQGFIVCTDWTAHAFTAGMDCYVARPGSVGLIAGQITYGMFKRTVPDDVASQSNRLNVQVTGTATELSWAYIEILPAGGAGTAETGTARVALSAAGIATKVASCAGTASVALAATGGARKTAAAAGTAAVVLTASGVETVAGARQQSGTCTVALRGTGTATKSVSRTGAAQVVLATAGSARKTAAPAGTATVAIRSAAAAAKSVSRTGTAELALRAAGSAAKTAPATGSGVVALRTGGIGSKSVSRTGAAALVLSAAASSAVARLQTGACVLPLTTSSAARKIAAPTGTARAAVVTTGVEVKRATPTAAAVLALRCAGAARKTSTPTATSAIALRGTGTPTALRTQAARCVAALGTQSAPTARRTATGRGLLALQAHSFVGAPPPPPPVGMDQGSTTAPLLSGTATPGPTLAGDVAAGITSDMALVVASSLG